MFVKWRPITMETCFIMTVTFLVARQAGIAMASPWPVRGELLGHVEIRLVGGVHQPQLRTTRQARPRNDVTNMPENLHFRFHLGTRQLDLHVERRSSENRGVADFPLFVIRDGQIRRKEVVPDNNVELYSNRTTGSSFIIRKSATRAKFILEGFFYDGLDRLHLTPDPRGGLHRIHKQAREVDLRDDYIGTTSYKEGVIIDFMTSTHGPFSTTMKKGHARSKRELEGQQQCRDHEIRLFMVTDYQEYMTWWKYYQQNATRTEIEMNHFYSFIANSINIRYKSVKEMDATFNLEIVITGLLIVNSPTVSMWTEGNTMRPGSRYVDAHKALEAFGQWVKRRHEDLPDSHHWMLFTGFDIYTDRNPVVAGLARLGTICSTSSVSIIEQDNTGSVGATAAHELGHSLGSLHDGEESDCLDEDNYVMSRKLKIPDNETRASRPWQFSRCSVRAFKRFLSKVHCTNKSTHGQPVVTSGLSPGQIFSADKQCQLALGNGSFFARSLQYREGYSTLCRRLYCAVPEFAGYYQAIFPMDRTSCGDRKWCHRGRCETHPGAPVKEDHCPQGDDPTAPCVLEDCPLYSPRSRLVFCCHTCRDRSADRKYVTGENSQVMTSNVINKFLLPTESNADHVVTEAGQGHAPTTAEVNITSTLRPRGTPDNIHIAAEGEVNPMSLPSTTTTRIPTSGQPTPAGPSVHGHVATSAVLSNVSQGQVVISVQDVVPGSAAEVSTILPGHQLDHIGPRLQDATLQQSTTRPHPQDLAFHLGLWSDLDLHDWQLGHAAGNASDGKWNMVDAGGAVLTAEDVGRPHDSFLHNVVAGHLKESLADAALPQLPNANTSLVTNGHTVTSHPVDDRFVVNDVLPLVALETNDISLAPSDHSPRHEMTLKVWSAVTTPAVNSPLTSGVTTVFNVTESSSKSYLADQHTSSLSAAEPTLGSSKGMMTKLRGAQLFGSTGVDQTLSDAKSFAVLAMNTSRLDAPAAHLASKKVETNQHTIVQNTGPGQLSRGLHSEGTPVTDGEKRLGDVSPSVQSVVAVSSKLADARQGQHHALEVTDYTVNWSAPANDRAMMIQNPQSQPLADELFPRGHKVEIISFQHQVRSFLKELSSLEAELPNTPHPDLQVTAVTHTPSPPVEESGHRFLPNCRLQCVFFRELTGNDQLLDHLLLTASSPDNRTLPSSALGAVLKQ